MLQYNGHVLTLRSRYKDAKFIDSPPKSIRFFLENPIPRETERMNGTIIGVGALISTISTSLWWNDGIDEIYQLMFSILWLTTEQFVSSRHTNISFNDSIIYLISIIHPDGVIFQDILFHSVHKKLKWYQFRLQNVCGLRVNLFLFLFYVKPKSSRVFLE